MKRRSTYWLSLVVCMSCTLVSRGQEINYDSLLQRVDTVENPVYKPVVSFSFGVLSFLGDVRNTAVNPVIGNYAGQVNVSTFIDPRRNYIANFNFLLGQLGASATSYSETSRNLNFQTSLYSIGLNVEYRFGHFFPASSFIRPYVSAGAESINFSSKSDLLDAEGNRYHYWSDGTIRDMDEGVAGPSDASVIYRDYVYETDLRLREKEEFGLGDYSQRTFGVPFGAGFHLRISQRAFLSLGATWHYAMTDFIDNVAYEGTSIRGSRGNDSYLYSHLSLHFDLFSDPTTRTVDLLYAEAEFDPLFFDDEDGDFVLDVSDRCPGTPYGVEVDTLGCPLDGDGDGVPDYQDREPDTPAGNWVDEDGTTLTEAEFQKRLSLREHAMPRENVEAYMALIRGDYNYGPAAEIPEKFQSLDADGDGYLSFEELLSTVDRYFDYRLDLTLEELRQVNEFFFSQ